MYNGIGLTSVRGSGTNGYVQRNMAHVSREQTARRKSMDIPLDRDQVKAPKGANLEILEHNRKREIEVKVMKLRLSLEEKGHLKDDEVEAKCDAFRQELLSKLPARSGGPGGSVAPVAPAALVAPVAPAAPGAPAGPRAPSAGTGPVPATGAREPGRTTGGGGRRGTETRTGCGEGRVQRPRPEPAGHGGRATPPLPGRHALGSGPGKGHERPRPVA